ncbi:MAG: hypothetical protein RR588_12530, partial [Solibacillus sp.]
MAKIFRQTGTIDNPTGIEYGDLIIKKDGKLNTVAQNGAIVGIDAAKLGGQPPTYYAKKTEVDAAQGTADAAAKITDLMLIGNRGQRNDANNIPNGVTWCATNTPHNAHSFVWQIQYDSDKV